MNLKLFTTALLATGATAAWTAEDFDARSEAFSNHLPESHQNELDVHRRSDLFDWLEKGGKIKRVSCRPFGGICFKKGLGPKLG